MAAMRQGAEDPEPQSPLPIDDLDRGQVDRGRECDKGSITGSQGVPGRSEQPSVATGFNELRVSAWLSRQMSGAKVSNGVRTNGDGFRRKAGACRAGMLIRHQPAQVARLRVSKLLTSPSVQRVCRECNGPLRQRAARNFAVPPCEYPTEFSKPLTSSTGAARVARSLAKTLQPLPSQVSPYVSNFTFSFKADIPGF